MSDGGQTVVGPAGDLAADGSLAPAVDVIAEGVLIAMSATRMAAKNFILLGALRDHLDYDEQRIAAAVVCSLHQLAEESLETAARLDALYASSPSSPLRSDGQRAHDLARRRGPSIHRDLARELSALSEDDARVAALVREAKTEAANELLREVSRRLASQFEPDADYEFEREKRLRKLRKVDLKDLRKRRHPQAPR